MTVSTMYDTSMDVKIFTFDLAGKCESCEARYVGLAEIMSGFDVSRLRMKAAKNKLFPFRGKVLNTTDQFMLQR